MEMQKYATQSDREGRLVQLDCELTDELIFEGYANELCAQVMSLRKEKNCALDDSLDILFVTDNQTLVEVIQTYKDMLFDRLICNRIHIETQTPESRIDLIKDTVRPMVYLSVIVNINEAGKLTFQKF